MADKTDLTIKMKLNKEQFKKDAKSVSESIKKEFNETAKNIGKAMGDGAKKLGSSIYSGVKYGTIAAIGYLTYAFLKARKDIERSWKFEKLLQIKGFSQRSASVIRQEFDNITRKFAEEAGVSRESAGNIANMLFGASGVKLRDLEQTLRTIASLAAVMNKDFETAGEAMFRILETGSGGRLLPGLDMSDMSKSERIIKLNEEVAKKFGDIWASGQAESLGNLISKLEAVTVSVGKIVFKAVEPILSAVNNKLGPITEKIWLAAEALGPSGALTLLGNLKDEFANLGKTAAKEIAGVIFNPSAWGHIAAGFASAIAAGLQEIPVLGTISRYGAGLGGLAGDYASSFQQFLQTGKSSPATWKGTKESFRMGMSEASFGTYMGQAGSEFSKGFGAFDFSTAARNIKGAAGSALSNIESIVGSASMPAEQRARIEQAQQIFMRDANLGAEMKARHNLRLNVTISDGQQRQPHGRASSGRW